MKREILKILKDAGGTVSGERLSSRLRTSRVSIWKHVRWLQENGYPITSIPKKGYRLEGVPDLLFPWEFPEREELIHYFPEVWSTIDTAKEMARDGAPHFSVVIAEKQTGGRGRLKRAWHSEGGGLYFTLILRPEVPLAASHRINFLASLTLAQTLLKLFSVDARVKWPNDILIDGKKLSGMLSELESEAEMVSFLNISIGINVNNDPTPAEPNAVSLRRLLGKEVSRRLLLASFLDAFEDGLQTFSLDQVIPEWKKWSCTLHRPVRIVTFKETAEGMAVDVDANGGLILELSDGTRKTVTFGDCFHRSDPGPGAQEEVLCG